MQASRSSRFGAAGAGSSADSAVLKLKGLPWSTQEQDLLSFFQGFGLRHVAFVTEADGRPSGLAFAEFESGEEAGRAMTKNGQYIGDRYVKLLRVPREEMLEQTAGSSGASSLMSGSGQSAGGSGGLTFADPPPTNLQSQGLLQQGLDIRHPAGMGMDLAPGGRFGGSPSGDAFMSGRSGMQPGSRQLGAEGFPMGAPGPGGYSMALGSSPSSAVQQITSGGFNLGPGLGLGALPPAAASIGFAPGLGTAFDAPRPFAGINLSGSGPITHLPMGQWGNAPFGAASAVATPDFQASGGGGPGYAGSQPGRPLGGFLDAALAKAQSARPDGATVKIRGLPFRASPAEILDFFKGYQYIPGSLHLGTDGRGRASGEAWITFISSQEAERCVQERNRQYLGSRYLELSIC